MVLETQSIKTSPSFEEANGVCASHTRNGSADRRSYFLGEVMQPYQAEPGVELNLSVGDRAIVPKIEKIQEFELSNFNSKIRDYQYAAFCRHAGCILWVIVRRRGRV